MIKNRYVSNLSFDEFLEILLKNVKVEKCFFFYF